MSTLNKLILTRIYLQLPDDEIKKLLCMCGKLKKVVIHKKQCRMDSIE